MKRDDKHKGIATVKLTGDDNLLEALQIAADYINECLLDDTVEAMEDCDAKHADPAIRFCSAVLAIQWSVQYAIDNVKAGKVDVKDVELRAGKAMCKTLERLARMCKHSEVTIVEHGVTE